MSQLEQVHANLELKTLSRYAAALEQSACVALLGTEMRHLEKLERKLNALLLGASSPKVLLHVFVGYQLLENCHYFGL